MIGPKSLLKVQKRFVQKDGLMVGLRKDGLVLWRKRLASLLTILTVLLRDRAASGLDLIKHRLLLVLNEILLIFSRQNVKRKLQFLTPGRLKDAPRFRTEWRFRLFVEFTGSVIQNSCRGGGGGRRPLLRTQWPSGSWTPYQVVGQPTEPPRFVCN